MRQKKDLDLGVDSGLVVGGGTGLVVLDGMSDVAALWVLVHALLTAKYLSGHTTKCYLFSNTAYL